MADQNVKVKIDLDVSEFNKNAKAMSDALSKILGRDVEMFNGKIAKTKKLVEDTEKAMGSTASATGKVGSAVKKSNQQWTNFALILQDLPYGFRGIQNNLPAVIGGFAGMAGPLYLAASAVIALFTAWDNGMLKFTSGLSTFREENKNAVKEVATQSTEVALLVAQYSKSNTSLEERKGILNRLNSISPEYFGNLNKENTSVEALNKSYLAYIGNLSNIIKAKKLEEKLGKKIEERLQFEQEAGIALLKTGYRNPEYIKEQNAALAKYNNLLLEETRLAAQIVELSKVPIKDVKLTQEKTKAIKEEDPFIELNRQKRVSDEIRAFEMKLYSDLQKLEDDKVKESQDRYKQQLSDFDEFYKNRQNLETNDRLGKKALYEQEASDLQYMLDNNFISYDDYLKRISTVFKNWTNNNTAMSKEALANVMKIGNGLMSALGPSLDLLLDKGASINEVLDKAFKDLVKQITKVTIAAGIAVALLAAMGLVNVKDIGKVFGMLFSQGMGLGSLGFAAPTKAASSTPISMSSVDTTTSGQGMSFILKGQDLLLSVNRAQKASTLKGQNISLG